MAVKIYDNLVFKPLSEIHPYENNPRQNEEAVQALINTLPVTGFNVPLVIDEDGDIINGHSRYETLKKLGYEAAPCIVVPNDPKNAEARLVDNKVSELSEWDSEKLNQELREMPINLRDMGISNIPQVRRDVEEVKATTQEEVIKTQDKLLRDDIMTKGRKAMIEVTCEGCGETYFVTEEEAEKYAE